ncbi:hypothetical protein IJI55_03325 [Candidatus Saccharibacteria bacterium]|nr:hypothetical protein [Candidatus Saccharibacteria bacterium]
MMYCYYGKNVARSTEAIEASMAWCNAAMAAAYYQQQIQAQPEPQFGFEPQPGLPQSEPPQEQSVDEILAELGIAM